MDGRLALWILIVVFGEQLGRRFLHPYFGLIYVPLAFFAMWAAARWRDRLTRQRLQNVASLPLEAQRAAADALPTADERSTARLALGLIDPIVDAPRTEEVFAYPQSWVRWTALTFWICVGMTGLILAMGYAQDVAERDDFLSWLGLVIGFLIGAFATRWTERRLRAQIFISQSGIGEITPSGERMVILWSQLRLVRNRPWLGQVEFHSYEHRHKVVASYALGQFPRFMEKVEAQLAILFPADAA